MFSTRERHSIPAISSLIFRRLSIWYSSQDKHRSVPNYWLFEWNDSLAYYTILGEVWSSLSFIVVFFKTLNFLLLLLVFFSRHKEEHTSQYPNVLVGLIRWPMIRKKLFWLSTLVLKDIPHNSESRETLNRVHVKYVLPKDAFMSRTAAIFVLKVGLIWLKSGLLLQLCRTQM